VKSNIRKAYFAFYRFRERFVERFYQVTHPFNYRFNAKYRQQWDNFQYECHEAMFG
jgi:hypothetical protein